MEKGIEDENEILLFWGVHIADDIVALFFPRRLFRNSSCVGMNCSNLMCGLFTSNRIRSLINLFFLLLAFIKFDFLFDRVLQFYRWAIICLKWHVSDLASDSLQRLDQEAVLNGARYELFKRLFATLSSSALKLELS